MDINKILSQAVEVGADQLISDYNARDFNTTGELASSIHASGGKILAKRYIFDLIYGQKPKVKFAEYKEGSSLFNWTSIKINPSQNKIKSVAYLIARRLFDEGDRIYREEREGLDIEMTRSRAVMSFKEKIRIAYKNKVKEHNE